MVYGSVALKLEDPMTGGSDFDIEVIHLFGSPDDWISREQQEGYYIRALEVLNQYRDCVMALTDLEIDLDEKYPEISWEDAFCADDGMRGLSYDKDRVQSSNISNIPEQVYIAAEEKIERRKAYRERLFRDMAKLKKRIAFSQKMLTYLRGDTRTVAECFWFSDENYTWNDIADLLGKSHGTVSIAELDLLTIGLVLDMWTERANDHVKAKGKQDTVIIAGQEEFDKF